MGEVPLYLDTALVWAGELPWRECGSPNRHDDAVDSDKQVVQKQVSLRAGGPADAAGGDNAGGDSSWPSWPKAS